MKANLTNLLFLLAATSLAILASLDEVKGNHETDLIVGADGLQCNSCGAECSVMCGSRKFRTCCFNYIKKRSSGTPYPRHPTKNRILFKRQSEGIPIQQQQQQMQQQPGDEILETTKQLNDGGFLTRVETLPVSAITILAIPDKVLVDQQQGFLQSFLSKLKENSENLKNSYH